MYNANTTANTKYKMEGDVINPDPYMDMLNKYGLPWVVDENPVLVP